MIIGIPRRYSHFVFAVLQSGLTCAIATAIASATMASGAQFLGIWARTWLLSWLAMAPVVVVAAPLIRRLSLAVASRVD